MKSSHFLFVTVMFFSVAVAASAQSTIGGTYYGTTEVLANANEHLADELLLRTVHVFQKSIEWHGCHPLG